MAPDRTNGSSPSGSRANPTDKVRSERTRLACVACRAVKQRCDGPTRNPCRRCEQFSIECVFKDGPRMSAAEATRISIKTKPSTSSSSSLPVYGQQSPPQLPFPPPPPIASTSHAAYPPQASMPLTLPSPHAYPFPMQPPGSYAPPDLQQTLRDIAGRLGRLEEALLPEVSGHGSQSPMHDGVSPDLATANFKHPAQDEGTPLSQVQSSVVRLSTLGDVAAAASPAFSGSGQGDAISRGFITAQAAGDLFAYFFNYIHPTFPITDAELDSDPATVRQRNSLLFHSILLAAAYYLLLHSPHGRQSYRAIASLVADAIGRQLLFARARPNGQLSRDVVVAIMLGIVRKALYTELSDDNAAEISIDRQVASKINYDAGFLCTGLAARALLLLGLNQISERLLQAADAEGYLDPARLPHPEVIKQCRLWYHLCLVDAHGSISASRAPSLVTANAVRASSIFAALMHSPNDVWTAALLHLALLAREHFGRADAGSERQTDLDNLRGLARSIGIWSNTWTNRIGQTREVQGGRDGRDVRYELVVASMHGHFLHLSAATTFFRRWVMTGEPIAGEMDAVGEAIEAARALLRSLASGGGAANEASRVDGHVVGGFKVGPDNALTVVLPFSALFLAKHAATKAGSQELITLAADFLDAAAPHPTHPCVGHARILRTCIPSPASTNDGEHYRSACSDSTLRPPIDASVSVLGSDSLLSMLMPSTSAAPPSPSMPFGSLQNVGGQPLMELNGIDWTSFGFGEGFGGLV